MAYKALPSIISYNPYNIYGKEIVFLPFLNEENKALRSSIIILGHTVSGRVGPQFLVFWFQYVRSSSPTQAFFYNINNPVYQPCCLLGGGYR